MMPDRDIFFRGYGKPNSWCLEAIKKLGFKPIYITTMLCEQTFVFETEKEAIEACNTFQKKYNTNEGWWYGLDGQYPWEQTVREYVKKYGTITIFAISPSQDKEKE